MMVAPIAMPAERTDDELLAAGDSESFAIFYRRHVEWVLGFLQRRTRDPELAADLASEVFAAALVARKRYKPRDGRANSWLFRIALNKLTDAQRRGWAEDRARRQLRMQPVLPDDADLRRIEALGDEVEAMVYVRELPPEQRAAISAHVLHGRSYADIAGQLGVSEAVTRKRVSRGLAALRTRMGGQR
jgi:RNA polymerase sigma factor (sigma-70 family)